MFPSQKTLNVCCFHLKKLRNTNVFAILGLKKHAFSICHFSPFKISHIHFNWSLIFYNQIHQRVCVSMALVEM